LEKEDKKMPQFILATAAFILKRQGSPEATAHEALHATTRTRAATRRLRASRMHEPYVDLSPLGLSTRH
jgi:hypothetical protein